MAEKIFDGRIESPRKTHAVWTSQNPVLRYGERVTVILEDGSIRHKTGDGVAPYIGLPFDEEDIVAAIARFTTAVLYGQEQDLTDEQKAQARANIGAASAEPEVSYTNYADQTSSEWADDTRINSSKQTVSATGVDMTNYIPITPTTSFVHVKGLDILSALANGNNYGRVYFYDSSKTYLGYAQPSVYTTYVYSASYDDAVIVIDYQGLGVVIKNSVTIANVAYIRLGGIPTASEIIITIDEDIVAKDGSSEHEERITALEDRVTALEEDANREETDTIAVPDYWQTAVDEAITKVKALQDEGGSDVINFAWFSDLHFGGGKDYTGRVGILTSAVMDACDIPLALMNGDTLTAGSLATEDAVLTYLEGAMTDILAPIGDERLMLVRGNHDDVYGSYTDGDTTTYYVNKVAPEKIWNALHRPQATDTRRVFGGDGTYFYLDNVPQKVRFVCLNSQFYDGEAVTNGTTKIMTTGFGTEQLDWLENVALAVDEGWGVVVSMHTPPISAYASLYVSEDYTRVRGIITEAADRMIAVFCGHMHRDMTYTDDLPCPIVVITCAFNTPYDGTEAERVVGTTTETAIDIVSINRATKTIHTTRLGWGSDREVSYTGGASATDYPTTALKALIDAAVSNIMPEFVDSVEEMTDQSKKYVLTTTGTVWQYDGTVTETEVTVEKTDNVEGDYYDGCRLGSSATSFTDGFSNDAAGYHVTPLIDLTKAEYQGKTITIHLNGAKYITQTAETWIMHRSYTVSGSVQYARGNSCISGNDNNLGLTSMSIESETSATITATIPFGNVGYLRFCGKGVVADSNIYITYTDTEIVTSMRGWYDTEVAFSGGGGGGSTTPDIDVTEIAEQAAALVDTNLLSMIGSGEVSV